MKTPTGLKDKDGTEIFEGDMVEFWFSFDEGISSEPRPNFTRMLDLVEIHDGQPYFVDKCIGSGALAWRYNEYCKVIGNIYDAPKM
jgi:uncharacterized phage protein (TIGR01671 family)